MKRRRRLKQSNGAALLKEGAHSFSLGEVTDSRRLSVDDINPALSLLPSA
jgi:hypothetical protein